MYLVSSPVNARRLMDSVARLEQRIHKAEAVSFIQKRFKCFWIKKPPPLCEYAAQDGLSNP